MVRRAIPWFLLCLSPLCLACAGGTSGAGSTPPSTAAAAAAEADQSRIQGEWVLAEGTVHGEPLNLGPRDRQTWTFKGDRYSIRMERYFEEGTFALDESAEPRRLELVSTRSRAGVRTVESYKFTPDGMLICNKGGKEAPGDFTSTPDNKQSLYLMKRP